MAKTKKEPTKKQLKALEKARKAKARKRKEELRKKREEFVYPFYSEITKKRYKTEAGMERAEEEWLRKHPPGGPLIPKIILDAEATLPRDWSSLGYKKNCWPHTSSRGPMRLIFYEIQGDWDEIYEDSIREAYKREGLDKKMDDGHSLRNFITEIMGVEDTDEMVLEDGEEEDIFSEFEVDFS